jgi:DNA-binding transcriptional LysR family regulator
MTAVPSYVRNGLGIAVVPDVGLGPAPGTVRLKITDMTAPWRLTIATLAGRPPSRALRTLLDLIDTEMP